MAVQHPFQTPQNERSFSSLVDQVVLETGKTQALRSVVQYANLSIRECQALVLSARDLIEDEIEADEDPFQWEPPLRFRSMRAVRYQTSGCYPKFKQPGRQLENLLEYYYRSGTTFIFKGVLAGEGLAIGYYMWSRALVYNGRLNVDTTAYPQAPSGGYAIRPAYFDTVEDEWRYLNVAQDDYVSTLGDETEEETRRDNALHWTLEDWYDMIVEGAKAKVFKQYNDDRFGATFASYKYQQELFRRNIFEAESHENVD